MTFPHDEEGLVRPFTITGGRTLPPGRALDLTTLLYTMEAGASASRLPIGREERQILELCRCEVLSIAEVSAQLRLPFGVVRVLVADLNAQRLLAIQPPPPPTETKDRQILEKVLSGLRKL